MLEAVFKLIIGLIAAYLVMKATGSVALAAGGAILGVTVSCLISALYLHGKFRPAYRELPQTREEASSFGKTAKGLLAIAVPITIGSAGLQLLTVIETSLYMDRLVELLDTNRLTSPLADAIKADILASDSTLTSAQLHSKVAANMKGVYNFAQNIYNLPNSFITPITVSIIPAITAQLTLDNRQGVKATSESAARITSLISLPCAVGLMLLAEPIMALLGGYAGHKLTLATQLMAILGVSVFLHAVVLVTNAIMQAHGHANIPVMNMLSSGVVRLVVVFLLAGNPAIGILGVPIGTALCNLCIALLNILSIHRVVEEKPAITSNLLRSFVPAVIMGAAAFSSWKLLKRVGMTSRLILCGGPLVLAVAVYVVCAVLFKSITRDDCMLLPKGEKIAKLLRL